MCVYHTIVDIIYICAKIAEYIYHVTFFYLFFILVADHISKFHKEINKAFPR